ncbi:hypothetical protein HHK36_010182 [Tetracentron sinense]|uniref:Ubiquitin-conjugating enzyme E2C-binding protein n=1 Tax=Tetracentron sinense TaxID=13715 RepID=A0A834ZH36_TETSI|nr:hypothetical protein HHK36_010182 [Tetracentron sinense]
MSFQLSAAENPSKWRFTWETLAHIPTLRLILFNPKSKPANQCKNLEVSLNFEESVLLVGWIEDIEDRYDGPVNFSLRVPIPRVLIDHGSPVDFRVMEDHIEIKLVLLLRVDHPIVANFDFVLDLSEEGSCRENVSSDRLQPLSMDTDLKSLSCREGVHFYCKSCSMKLTRRPLRSFVEMPSVNWREVADNWFGACCCSFGGISEQLVTKYANSFICAVGTCLLDATSVIVCKDDLVGFIFPDCDGSKKRDFKPDLVGECDLTEVMLDSGSNNDTRAICCGNQSERMFENFEKLSCMPHKKENFDATEECEGTDKANNGDTSFCTSPAASDFCGIVAPAHGLSAKYQCHYCVDMTSYVPNQDHEDCSHGVSGTASKDQGSSKCIELLTNQKSLLNGSLGNVFMVRSSNLSKDVQWIEFMCAQCSSPLGAYPCISDSNAPLDGGVRLFKCCWFAYWWVR